METTKRYAYQDHQQSAADAQEDVQEKSGRKRNEEGQKWEVKKKKPRPYNIGKAKIFQFKFLCYLVASLIIDEYVILLYNYYHFCVF